MVIYQHPSALWAAFKKSDPRCEPTTSLLPTRIRIKNNGDGTGTARLVEAPPTVRRSSFSLFNHSIKQGSKRKLSLTLIRRSSEKAIRRDDEGFESGHAQGAKPRSRFDIITRMPTEVATLIFQYCDLQSILAVTRVSKSWHNLAMQNPVWHSLVLQQPAWDLPPHKDAYIDYIDLYRRRLDLKQRWRKGQVETRYLEGHEDSVYCLQFDNEKIISGSRDKKIKVWNSRTYQCMHTLQGHTASVLCLRYHGNMLVSGSSDTSVRVWNLDTMELSMQLNGHTSGVLDVCFNDEYIISCSKDTTIRVWDRFTGEPVATLNGHRGPVNSVQVHGDQLVSAAGDGLVKLWDLKKLALKRDFVGHTRGLACVQFDGKRILSGSNDKKIKVWDAKTGECTMTLEGHEDLVRTLSFNEDMIVSGSYDQTIRVWDIHTGHCMLSFQTGHPGWVFSTAFSATRIISTSQDSKIMCMDFSSGLDTKFIV
ncbi:hypothetical protein INT44_000528 [Umbelopsis vinacea]|uniref:F-box domain-containing protein n=1 Tax=Umbelopsis vinacea TaxID=44442 RepID=A0A8H7UE23_9FUNG|nr:hypothetical protein INT44_000528 [Umbelopsis vinacea]